LDSKPSSGFATMPANANRQRRRTITDDVGDTRDLMLPLAREIRDLPQRRGDRREIRGDHYFADSAPRADNFWLKFLLTFIVSIDFFCELRVCGE